MVYATSNTQTSNSGRPLTFPINCHTSNMLRYIDYHLQPIVKQIPSYIRDTSDFSRKINTIETVPYSSYLVTLVIRSLFKSITCSKGIKKVKTSLENFQEEQ